MIASVGSLVIFISIHALLAESDSVAAHFGRRKLNFYPRSPCGERPAVMAAHISI